MLCYEIKGILVWIEEGLELKHVGDYDSSYNDCIRDLIDNRAKTQ